MTEDFSSRRQTELAAEREARRQALERGEMVFDPPGPSDRPEVVAVVETRLPAMYDAPGWVRQKRRETLAILTDGALRLAGTDLRVQRDAPQPPEASPARPAPRSAPRKSVAKAKPAKTRQKPQKAAQRASRPRKVPKVRPAPKPRQERPAPPDELRCTAITSKGSRCRFEAVADGRCLLHGSAG